MAQEMERAGALAPSIDGLFHQFPIGSDPSYYVRFEGTVPNSRNVEFRERLTEREIVQRLGPGVFDVQVFGPDPRGRRCADGQIQVRPVSVKWRCTLRPDFQAPSEPEVRNTLADLCEVACSVVQAFDLGDGQPTQELRSEIERLRAEVKRSAPLVAVKLPTKSEEI